MQQPAHGIAHVTLATPERRKAPGSECQLYGLHVVLSKPEVVRQVARARAVPRQDRVDLGLAGHGLYVDHFPQAEDFAAQCIQVNGE
jgi:hypothetical protein